MAHIICLGSVRWVKLGGRTQNLLSRLSRHHKILYFQPPPSLISQDIRKGDHKKQAIHPQKNISLYTLPPVFHLNNYDHPRLLGYNVKKMTKYIQEKAKQEQIVDPLLWLCSPFYYALLDTLQYKGMVYDCYQDWSLFDIRWESIVANRADILFAASPGLADHLAPCNTNIALIPNGGNLSLYRKSEDLTLQAPDPLLRIPSPLLGYLGDVTRDVDLRPVYRAAKANPRWHFVFAGRCSRENPLYQTLLNLNNVHFLGKVPQSELPVYGAHFDVLIELLDTDDPEEDVVSSRIYEYLMIGKPIVSMYPARYTPAYPDVIYGARSPKEFSDQCLQALMENSGYTALRRKQYGAEADWNLRAQLAQQILENISLL
ncbi:MAG: hypothetical protein IJD21_06515 [Oscillospiraceae bacterium]|nr:hypothetical protein [Oscillospiraceae bacterium]